MEIALYGGSFNPPHVGHLLACSYVLATEPLDRLWLLPAFKHPFGKELAPWEDRVRMCELLAAELPAGRAEVSRAEEAVGTGYTVDVLRRLSDARPEDRFALVVGADVLKDAPQWRAFDEVRRLARLVVLGRGGFGDGGSAVTLPGVSSTEIRERLARGESVAGLLPRRVLAYVEEKGLYRK